MNIFDRWRLSRQGYSDELLSRMKRADIEKAHKLLVDLQVQTEMLTKKDIGAWRMAWQRAIDVQNPNRCALLDIYTDVAIDLHLTGCVGQRKGFVSKRGFKLVDKSGKKNDEVTALFEAEWFDEFVSLVLDSRYYGHSLIQFDVPIEQDGQMQFPIPELVPRKHVRPEYGVIVRNQNDVPQSGINYRDGEFADWCIEVGKPHDLGLYLKCCPSALSKKNMLAFWDGFGEIFGMPIRIAKTMSQDIETRGKIETMLSKMGAAFYGVFPNDTEIEIKESSKGSITNVSSKRGSINVSSKRGVIYLSSKRSAIDVSSKRGTIYVSSKGTSG